MPLSTSPMLRPSVSSSLFGACALAHFLGFSMGLGRKVCVGVGLGVWGRNRCAGLGRAGGWSFAGCAACAARAGCFGCCGCRRCRCCCCGCRCVWRCCRGGVARLGGSLARRGCTFCRAGGSNCRRGRRPCTCAGGGGGGGQSKASECGQSQCSDDELVHVKSLDFELLHKARSTPTTVARRLLLTQINNY